jgi:hypothetical protein
LRASFNRVKSLAFAQEGNTAAGQERSYKTAMKISGGFAALIGALVLLCAVIAWEWYSHMGGSSSAPRPVAQLPAASAPASSTPAPPTGKAKPSTAAPAGRASAAPAASATPNSTPTPVEYVVQAAPSPSPAPAAYQAGPTSAVTEQPMVAATLAPHVVAIKPISAPANAPPRILAMSLSTPVARGGQIVSGTVETSSNVASVEARIAGYSSNMQKVGVGKFRLSYRVPYLPFFLHRTYSIEVIARNTRGDAVRTSVPITIR